MPTYRILSFDGGGIRGLVTLAILKRVEEEIPGFVSRADLLAGTSTGGIIALGLAAGKTVDDMIELYQKHGEKIFDDSWLDDLRDLGTLVGADYSQDNLEELLSDDDLFGEMRLKDLKQRVLVPTFDLDNGDGKDAVPPQKRTWAPKFFHNFPGKDSDGNAFVVEVALATSAAPTYFPAHNGYIDGGVVANNPSMAALAQTRDPRNDEPAPALEDVRLLSIGTGTNLSFIKGRNLDWGLAQWAKPLISLLMDASMGIADYQCRRLLVDNHRRIAPTFPADVNIKLDDWKRSGELLAFGEAAALEDCSTGDKIVKWAQDKGW